MGDSNYSKMTRKQQKTWNHYIQVRRLNVVKDWLADHGPCTECGSWEKLEINQKDPVKVISTMVHRWRAELREPILAAAVVRCRPCRVRLMREQKVYCRHGHDLRIVGRAGDGYCKACEAAANQRNYEKRKAERAALAARKGRASKTVA